jgi:hypothetical protein
MLQRTLAAGCLLTIASFATITGAQAVSSSQPGAPAQLCVNNKCATTPTNSTSTGTLKFHPGIYPYFNYAGGVNLSRLGNGSDGKDLQLIQSLKPGDNVAGITVAILWRAIDKGTTGPSYDWSILDAYFNAAKAAGKRFWIRVQDGAYGANWSVANKSYVVPDWLINQYGPQNVMANYTANTPGSGVVAKRYNPNVTNAYIGLLQAIAARYDSDPMFEGVTLFEETAYGIDISGSSVTVATPGEDYTEGAMFTQLYNLMAAMRDPKLGFKTSNVLLAGNYLFRTSDSAANWNAVLTKVQQYKMVLGGADSWIEAWTYPDTPYSGPQSSPGMGGSKATNPQYFRNLPSDEAYRGWGPGLKDWRGKILFGPDVEMTDFGGYITRNMSPIPTLADVWQVRGPKLDNAHYFFFDIDFGPTGNYGGAPQQWSTGQYPWVKSVGPTNTVNPYK